MRLYSFLALAAIACTPAAAKPPSAPPIDTTNDAHCTDARPGPTHECVQECGPPVAQQGDPPPGWQWLTAADAASRRQYGCPICLPEDTRIATPQGDRPITTLAIGDEIWTLDEHGRRVRARIIHVGSTPVGRAHQLVQATLADGRVMRASAGHPDTAGLAVGGLAHGATLSGSTIVAIERVPYDGARTHDVLPSGSTGIYWADGVALRSSFSSNDD